MNLYGLIVATVSVIGGGGGIYALLTLGAARRKMAAETSSTLAGTAKVLGAAAAEMVAPLHNALELAESRAQTLNLQLAHCQLEVKSLRLEVADFATQLTTLRRAVLNPDNDLEYLRQLARGERS